jgi:hypothetical protein
MKYDDKLVPPPLSGDELLAKTLKTVAVLVAACVLFVGTLSLVAVIVTSRAVGPAAAEAAKDAPPAPQKPLSI